jgi:site-specific DNA-methyltransferase (adenine-specific)
MTYAHMILGDTRDVTARIPDGSIDLILTSPPFLALRSYLPADHADKHREIGSEATPADFIDMLLELTAEWARVLAPHGSLCVELGDSYSGGHTGKNKANDRPQDGGYASGERVHGDGYLAGIRNMDDKIQGSGEGWPLAKSATMIPELYRVALAYGINPLTGKESPAGRWRVRNTVRWHRPNPPVGALGDKFRPATSDMVIACKSAKRWFDLDAVRHTPKPGGYGSDTSTSNGSRIGNGFRGQTEGPKDYPRTDAHPAGAPPLDTWIIPTQGYRGSHFATFPKALCEIPIKSMCPPEVCVSCGTPRRRITSEPEYVGGGASPGFDKQANADGNVSDCALRAEHRGTGVTRQTSTIGWTVCDCTEPVYRPGIVLDPFGGSGTTAVVATGHGRHCLLIDIDERNIELARERVGMFLDVGEELPEWLPQ